MSEYEHMARQLAASCKTCKEVESHYRGLLNRGLDKETAKSVIKEAKEIVKRVYDKCDAKPFDVSDAHDIQKQLLLLVGKYLIGERYTFTVTNDKDKVSHKILLKDSYGFEHPVDLPSQLIDGDDVTATVVAYRYRRPQGRQGAKAYLILDNINLCEEVLSPNTTRSPEEWGAAVGDLPNHICGKPFICHCCGKNYAARQGVRVENTDMYFCNHCKKLIFRPSGEGWRKRIIYTPMGNKR